MATSLAHANPTVSMAERESPLDLHPHDNLNVNASQDGMRLTRLLAEYHPRLTIGIIARAIRRGEIRINGRKTNWQHRVQKGETLFIHGRVLKELPPDDRKQHQDPTNWIAPLARREELLHSIIRIDPDLVAIDKPRNWVCQSGKGRQHDTRQIDLIARQLSDADLTRARPDSWQTPITTANPLPQDPTDRTLRLIHRLDAATTGVLLLGRGRSATRSLGRCLERHQVRKIYLALVIGPHAPIGKQIDRPLPKGQNRTPKTPTIPAITQMAVLDATELPPTPLTVALVALRPITGRFHQLRRHMEHIGCPIIGDPDTPRQNVPLPDLLRQASMCLHATVLDLPPINQQPHRYICAPPTQELHTLITTFLPRQQTLLSQDPQLIASSLLARFPKM